MAKQNEYEINTDKSVRQLDKLEQKLSRVDRLFERAQRRGYVLSKMNITPALALNDKLSDHSTRIENRLMNLNRTTIAPSLHIADYATAEISGVAVYLRAITEKRWMINFEAISWGNLFTGNFSDWLKGQNLMTSIKEQLSNTEPFQEAGTLAGEQFFQSFLEAIDPEQVAEKFNEMQLNANVNTNSGSDSGSGSYLEKTWDFFLDVGKGALSNLLSDGVSTLIKNKRKKRTEQKLSKEDYTNDKPTNSGNKVKREKGKYKKNQRERNERKNKAEGGNKKDRGKVQERLDNKNKKNIPTKPQTTEKIKSPNELKKGEKFKNFFSDSFSWKPVPDLTKGIDYKGDKFNPISSLGQNAIKDLPDTKFLSKFIKGNAIGILMDAEYIASADSGKDRSKAVGSSVLSSVGAGVGGFLGSFLSPVLGTAAGAALGGNLGSDAGEWLGGKVHDLIYGEESSPISNSPNSLLIKKLNHEKLIRYFEDRHSSSSSTTGISGAGSSINFPAFPFGFVPTPPTPITPTATMQAPPEVQKQVLDPTIQVNLPVGAIQLTVNQPELNYDQIASVVGMKISSSVQLAWQNTKLR
jgi:uncharacterized membrane protein